MIFSETELAGAFLIEPEPHADERGSFARTFCRREFAQHGLETEVAQANVAVNRSRDTLRGLHYQAPPHADAKLVRCARGAVYDVIVDLRPGSPTRLGWLAFELSEANGLMLYVPTGFAHGYQTLADGSETSYLMFAFHEPGSERGVRWDDPALGIEWPSAERRIMSARDRAWPDLDPDAPG